MSEAASAEGQGLPCVSGPRFTAQLDSGRGSTGGEEVVNRRLLWEWVGDAGATWEPQADRVLGLYLAPFSGISHREQKQPSRAAPS